MTAISLKLGFTEEELLARRKYLGGSDANILMSGDDDAIHDLWLRKTGQAPEPDLSDVLPVQFGIYTEPLNVVWFERTTGRKVTLRNQFCPHPSRYFMACNLDGLSFTASNERAVFEAKCVNAFSNIDETHQKYMPQLHHNMYCADVQHAVLSVFVGTLKYEIAEVAMDEFYLAQLVDREKAFWECVERHEPPPRMRPIAAPVAPSAWRTVDLTGNNEFADAATDWLGNQAAAKKFAEAETRIKGDKKKKIAGLIEPDVGTATGHGIKVTRNKAGALTISAAKQEDQANA